MERSRFTYLLYIESWFVGHRNDAHKYGLMRQIGVEMLLFYWEIKYIQKVVR